MQRDRDAPAFIHDDEQGFHALVRLAANRHPQIARLYIEKDYWVTHTLDALQRAGFQVHFKGGTSLLKGFRLIERFSEDLDLKLDATWLPDVADNLWKSSEPKGLQARRRFFDVLLQRDLGPPLKWSELSEFNDEKLRNLGIRVDYPLASDVVDPLMRRYVLLEVGRARVTPFIECTVSSWVHCCVPRSSRVFGARKSA